MYNQDDVPICIVNRVLCERDVSVYCALFARAVCARLARVGEGVFETIPIEADYTVGDMKLWLKYHKNKDEGEYDLVGPKGKWKMGAGSEVRAPTHACNDEESVRNRTALHAAGSHCCALRFCVCVPFTPSCHRRASSKSVLAVESQSDGLDAASCNQSRLGARNRLGAQERI
eukprot:6212518-Pleurochrysis_carterae.AAC.13